MELLRCLHTLRQTSLRKAAQATDLARGLGASEVRGWVLVGVNSQTSGPGECGLSWESRAGP